MIAALLTGIAASPCMRVERRYGAVVLAVILFLLSLRRSSERRRGHAGEGRAGQLRRDAPEDNWR